MDRSVLITLFVNKRYAELAEALKICDSEYDCDLFDQKDCMGNSFMDYFFHDSKTVAEQVEIVKLLNKLYKTGVIWYYPGSCLRHRRS